MQNARESLRLGEKIIIRCVSDAAVMVHSQKLIKGDTERSCSVVLPWLMVVGAHGDLPLA